MTAPRPPSPTLISGARATDAVSVVTLQPTETALEVQARTVVNGQRSSWSNIVAVPAPPPVPPPGPPPLSITSDVIASGVVLAGQNSNGNPAAVLGDLYACIAAQSLAVRQGDQTVLTPIPSAGFDMRWNPSLAITPGRVWLWSVNGLAAWTPDAAGGYVFHPATEPPRLRCFLVNPDLTLTETRVVGPSWGLDSVAGPILALPDGSVLLLGYRMPYTFDGSHDKMLVMLSVARIAVGGGVTEADGPAVECALGFTGQVRLWPMLAPDGSLWVFSKGDSFHRAQLTIFDLATLAVKSFNPEIIGSAQGLDNVEGEFPNLTTDGLVLAYQDADYKFFSSYPNPFVKGSRVSLATFTAGGTLSTITRLGDDYVERINGCSLLPGNVLVGRPYSLATDLTVLGARRLPDGPWEAIGQTHLAQDMVAVAGNTVTFAQDGATPVVTRVTVT